VAGGPDLGTLLASYAAGYKQHTL